MAKHVMKETAPGGGRHRAAGEPADPITDKRVPGATLKPEDRRAHQIAAAQHQQQNLREHGA